LNLPLETKCYIAGFIDGEGCFSFHKEKTGYYSPFLSISNTNEDVINWFKNTLDWGYKGYVDNRREKPKWQLEMRGMKRLIPLLLDILPYLIVKKRHAELILEYCKSRLSKPFGPLTKREKEIIQEIRKLNKRGRY